MNVSKVFLLSCIFNTLFLGPLLVFGQVKYSLNENGTFDIIGKSIQVKNCYPAIDNRSLKPLTVKVLKKPDRIQYKLTEGIVELAFTTEGKAVAIKTSITGKIVCDFFSVLKDAEVSGGDRIYRTSSQILGNGGIKNWPKDKSDNSSCAMLTGLIPDSGSTLIISSRDFHKFLSYTNIYPTAHNNGKKILDEGFSTEKVPTNTLPSVYFTENPSAYEGMRNEAEAIASTMGVNLQQPPSYHWGSWYYAYYHLTNNMLSDYLKGFESVNPRIPVQTIQIDAGYHPHAGDWLEPSDKFPNGIEQAVKDILKNNYKAGIWIGPYMVGNKSKVYLEHPDWILRRTDGSPIINLAYYEEDRLWGAMDEEIYTLDTSNPEVMEYLRKVFRTFRKMGITFFKTDFMLFGAQASSDVKRFQPGKTSIEYQRDLFDMIRKEIGPESFWLGCIAPFAPMIGYADGMRISADIKPNWKGGFTMFEETKGNQHINNIWWQNDPDALILRTKYSHLNEEEVKSMALWVGMSGGMVNTSDLFHELPEQRRELFRFIQPDTSKTTATFLEIQKSPNLEVMVKKYLPGKSWAVLFTNRGEEAVNESFQIKDLTGVLSATSYQWGPEISKPLGEKEKIEIKLEPHSSILFYLSTDKSSPEKRKLNGGK